MPISQNVFLHWNNDFQGKAKCKSCCYKQSKLKVKKKTVLQTNIGTCIIQIHRNTDSA
jgi:hypothetical protein